VAAVVEELADVSGRERVVAERAEAPGDRRRHVTGQLGQVVVAAREVEVR
jgi:hypothetical protein